MVIGDQSQSATSESDVGRFRRNLALSQHSETLNGTHSRYIVSDLLKVTDGAPCGYEWNGFPRYSFSLLGVAFPLTPCLPRGRNAPVRVSFQTAFLCKILS